MSESSSKIAARKEDLPNEIIQTIISKLAPKSVVRCTSVSRSWYGFITSPPFLSTHLKHSLHSPNSKPCLILHVPTNVHTQKTCALYHDDGTGFNKVYEREMQMTFGSGTCSVFGSCNGLIGLSDTSSFGQVIYLWNPSIMKFKKISTTSFFPVLYVESTSVFLGFWHESSENDYQLLRILYLEEDHDSFEEVESRAEIYSLKTKTWRKLGTTKLPGRIDDEAYSPTFWNSSLYWVATHYGNEGHRFILSFNTQSEVFSSMELPQSLWEEFDGHVEEISLSLYQGCLAVSFSPPYPSTERSSLWAVWVLRGNGEWVKEARVNCRRNVMWAIGCTRRDEFLILTSDREVIAYDVGKHRSRILPSVGSKGGSWVGYMESLVFLDQKDEDA